jgi:hypothetical protein
LTHHTKELPDDLRSKYLRKQACRPASSALGACGKADPHILWCRGFGVGIRRLAKYKQGKTARAPRKGRTKNKEEEHL